MSGGMQRYDARPLSLEKKENVYPNTMSIDRTR